VQPLGELGISALIISSETPGHFAPPTLQLLLACSCLLLSQLYFPEFLAVSIFARFFIIGFFACLAVSLSSARALPFSSLSCYEMKVSKLTITLDNLSIY